MDHGFPSAHGKMGIEDGIRVAPEDPFCWYNWDSEVWEIETASARFPAHPNLGFHLHKANFNHLETK